MKNECDYVYACFPFQKYPTDKAYFIAKEILTTERTYLKDLEVITVVSRILYTVHIMSLINAAYLWKRIVVLIKNDCVSVKMISNAVVN